MKITSEEVAKAVTDVWFYKSLGLFEICDKNQNVIKRFWVRNIEDVDKMHVPHGVQESEITDLLSLQRNRTKEFIKSENKFNCIQ